MSDVADSLGIDPEKQEPEKVIPETTAMTVHETELDVIKDNVNASISCTGAALNQLSQVCEQSARSEDFSALASLNNSYLNANKLLLDIISRQQSTKDAHARAKEQFSGAGESGNTTVFIGSTSELLKIAKQVNKPDGDTST